MPRQTDNTTPDIKSDKQADILSTAHIVDALRKLNNEAHEAEPNAQRVKQLTQALFDRYLATAYAAPFVDPLEGPRLLAEFAAMHSGVTIVALNSRELEELLFDALGPSGAIGEKNAVNAVRSARAFFDWLGREFQLNQAIELVDLLGDDAVREFERIDQSVISDAVDRLLNEARVAGVDLSDQRAVEAFVLRRLAEEEGNERGSFADGTYADDFGAAPPPIAPTLTPEQLRNHRKKRKKNRKTARRSRKQNR